MYMYYTSCIVNKIDDENIITIDSLLWYNTTDLCTHKYTYISFNGWSFSLILVEMHHDTFILKYVHTYKRTNVWFDSLQYIYIFLSNWTLQFVLYTYIVRWIRFDFEFKINLYYTVTSLTRYVRTYISLYCFQTWITHDRFYREVNVNYSQNTFIIFFLFSLGLNDDIHMERKRLFHERRKDVSNSISIWKSGAKIIFILNSMEFSGIYEDRKI